jgi:DNA-binding MarR family transcriptional regulator
MKDSIVLAAQRAAHATAHAVIGAVAADDLTPSEGNALANLVDGPRTVGQLATAAGVRPTTLTSLLDRLERRGLLVRRPSPDDRRSLLVELTADGRSVARRVVRAIGDLERRALGPLSEEQRLALASALDALAEGSS